VAFTQIALAWVFGASAVSPGLGVSWGMELKRYAAALSSGGCTPDVVCPGSVALLHTVLLLTVCLALLGGVARTAER